MPLQIRKFTTWYLQLGTVIRLMLLQLAITAICMLIAGLIYPGYDITHRTISGLGNHAESPAWPFFTFQTLTAWFCLWPLFIHTFKVVLFEIRDKFSPESSQNPNRDGRRKVGKILLQVLLGLGLLIFLFAWIGYAIVGIFDDSAPTAQIHNVGSAIAFGGLAAGAVLWFFPLLVVKRFPKYPVVITLVILVMVVIGVSLMFSPLPDAWYTANSFWQWMSFFGVNVWIFSLCIAVWQYWVPGKPPAQ